MIWHTIVSNRLFYWRIVDLEVTCSSRNRFPTDASDHVLNFFHWSLTIELRDIMVWLAFTGKIRKFDRFKFIGFLVNASSLISATAIMQESLNEGVHILWGYFDVFGIVSFAIPSSTLLKFSTKLAQSNYPMLNGWNGVRGVGEVEQ